MANANQFRAFSVLSRFAKFTGASVLEIGGNQSCDAAKPFIEAGCSQVIVTGLDHVGRSVGNVHEGIKICNLDAHLLKKTFGCNAFDIVYGLSVIEHIPTPSNLLEQIYFVLKPGGFAFIEGQPIWTSRCGHHIWLRTPNNNYFFSDMPGIESINPIPDYAHLLMTPEELAENLRLSNVPENDALSICDFIYNSEKLNRLSHFELAFSVSNSPFIVLDALFTHNGSVSSQILQQLQARYGYCNDYSVNGIRYVLYKSL